jgi:hypothetical protein
MHGATIPEISNVLLAVATAGSVGELNLLLSPRSVTLEGPAGTDPEQAGKSIQILDHNGVTVACEDEAGGLSTRLCRDGDLAFRLVAYRGSPTADSPPAVFGASDLLVPMK